MSKEQEYNDGWVRCEKLSSVMRMFFINVEGYHE